MTASASVAVITVTGTARLNAAAKPKRGKSSSARDHFGLDIFTHHSLRLPTLVTSLSVIKRLSFIDWRDAGAQPPILSGCHLAPHQFVQRWPGGRRSGSLSMVGLFSHGVPGDGLHPRKSGPRGLWLISSGAEGVSYNSPTDPTAWEPPPGVGCKLYPIFRKRLVIFCQKLVRTHQPRLWSRRRGMGV